MPQSKAARVWDHAAPVDGREAITGNALLKFTRRSMRRLAWLGLFAIGLTAVMPTVSRSLMMPMAAMAYDCGPMAGHAAPDPGVPHGSPLDACGYCGLFCHVPFHMALPPALVLAVPPVPLPPVAVRSVAPVAPSLLAARPRGPPRTVV